MCRRLSLRSVLTGFALSFTAFHLDSPKGIKTFKTASSFLQGS